MGQINLDFSSVDQQTLLDEGIYNVTINKIEETTTNAGEPMLKVIFKESETGTAIFENYVLKESALWKLNELLKAAGYEISKENPIVDLNTDNLLGLEFKAKVTKREYEGREFNNIKKIIA